MSDQIGTASIGLAVDSSGVDAGLNSMEATVTRAGRSLSSLGRQGSSAVDDIGRSAGTSADTLDRATQRQARSIQRLTAEVQSGGRATREFQESIARSRGGDAAVAALRPYLDQLDQVRAAQQAAAAAALRGGQAFNTQSQSAAQLAANLRSVPAQLTDIVTSLQGGQQPLTVFLQQGGQLRDMFGSAGGAARALGGYLVSLISPLTVAAAAVAVLGVAYNQGSKEADAYRMSVILTGNAAGVTTSQLSAMAKQAADTAGTQGANAAALAQLVGTGKVAADQLGKASTTAVLSQKYLGQAVEDTVKNFADLGKAPLQASLKLNESLNYLTEATYRQIKALELQGKTTEAAKVAQTAYADAMSDRSKKVEASLGSLEKTWNATGSAAKKAWDFMLNIGREESIDDQIKKAETALKLAQKRQTEFIGTPADKKQAVDEAQIAVDRLKNIRKVQQVQAESDAADKKRFDAARENEVFETKFLTRKEQQTREIAKASQLVRDAAPRGQDAVVTEKAVQDRIAQIRASYADLNNQGIESQIAAIGRLGAAQEETAKKALILLQGDQAAGFNRSADKQQAYLQAVANADEAALVGEKQRLQQRLSLAAKESVSEDNQAAQAEKLADLRSQIALKDIEISNRRTQLSVDSRNADIALNRSAFEMLDKSLDARQADTQALKDQLQAQRDENETIGLTARGLEEMTTRRVEERASRLEQTSAVKDTILGMEDEAEELRKQAQLLRDLNKAQIDGAKKAASVNANKQFWESVDQAAQSAFSHIGEGGKAVFDRLKDSLKSGLLDMLYQLTVKKWIINIGTSLTGQSISGSIGDALALPGASTSSAAGSNALSFASLGKSVYDAVQTGFAGLSTAIGSGIASAGSLFGSEALSAFGAGLKGGALGSSTASAASGYAGTSAAGAGAATAPLITAAAGIAAGVLGGRALSGGYSAFGGSGNSAVNAGTAIGATVGSIVPVIGTAVGALVGGLIGGATNRLFGYKAPQIESQGIQGRIDATGVTGTSYLNTLQKGGLFRSDKRTSTTTALDSTSDAAFDQTVLAMITAVKGFGKAIGEETGSIDKYTKDFKLALTGDTAKDQELITKLFSDTGDELAGLLVPNLAKLTNEGETASAALQRVATDYVAMDAALGAIGLNFGSVGAASLEAREKLITLTGGLDNFVAQAEFFSQNFLSESERTAAVQKQLLTAFTDLGVTAIPKTRDEFKALVQGLDLTSEGGQKMYAGLLNIQQAFAAVTPQVDAEAQALAQLKEQRSLGIQLMQALGDGEGALAATRADAIASLTSDQAKLTQAQIYAAQDAAEQRELQIQLMEAQGDAEGALAARRAAALAALMTDSARLTLSQIYAAQDATAAAEKLAAAASKAKEEAEGVYNGLVTVADGALSRLSTAINAEKNSINAAYQQQADLAREATDVALKGAQASLDAAKDQASAISSVFKDLDAALKSTGIEAEQALLARRQIAQQSLQAALANPDGLANNDTIADALSTLTGQSNERLFGTFEEYARDQARTNNTIAALRDVAGGQVDNTKLTVKRLEEAIDAIKGAGDKQLAQLQADNTAATDRLDQQLAVQAAQLDALKGIDNTTLTVKQALDLVAAALTQLKANPTAQENASSPAATKDIESLYQNLLGRAADAAGLKFYKDLLSSGTSLAQIEGYIRASPEYQKLSQASGGAAVVQSATFEQVQALMGRVSDPVQNSTTLLAEIQRLNTLTENQQVTLDAIAEATGIAGDVLDRAQKGQPIAMEAV